jgi:murein DD-endopeptidase MepM/ murein hydrolase activator NlpD
MFKGLKTKFLSHIPKKTKVFIKLGLGVFVLVFFLNYQPILGFPPIKKNTAQAEEVNAQVQSIESQQQIAFQLPHPGYLSTPYSSFHPGIDIASGLGMPVHPIAKGKVIEAGFNFWGLGLTVEILHPNGFKSTYAHLGKTYVKKGQEVKETDLIGEVGLTGHTTGPHTHLELTKDGKNIDPLTVLPKLREFPKEEDFLVYSASSSASLAKK